MSGFTFVNNYLELYHTDRLHASDKGLPKDLIKFLHESCSLEEQQKISKYLRSLPSYPGHKHPSFGLDTGRACTASELAGLFKMLPLALLPCVQIITDYFHGTHTRSV